MSVGLTVVSVAYPLAKVGPSAAGGAEQVLGWLDTAWTARGWHSLVVAQAGSEVAGELFATDVAEGVLDTALREAAVEAHQAALDRALRSAHVDLIHMHGIDFHRYRVPREMPVLVTLHLPPEWYPREIWRGPANVQLQCVSETQRRACPAEVRDRLPVVQNGVPQPAPGRPTEREDYALVLSRICPEKRVHLAINAARRAGVPLVIAGETFAYEEHLAYLREEIAPRLDDGARLIRPVGGEVKADLLRRARCLLLPTAAPETSSLVAMEAAAAGTPVIAFASGAIPEIVEHGRTGFLVGSEAEMAEAILRVGEIDPAVCRATATRRFGLSRMVNEYASHFAQLLRAADAGGALSNNSLVLRCEAQ